MIDLKEKCENIIFAVQGCFGALNGLPNEVRKDDKERTGIQVLIREPGTRNLLFFPVAFPSQAAMFFAAEKAVRSYLLKDPCSQNSADPEKMEFAGSVMITVDGVSIQVSVSGMKAEEDVAIAVMTLAHIFNVNPKKICLQITMAGGRLPDCFYMSGHYLRRFLGLED